MPSLQKEEVVNDNGQEDAPFQNSSLEFCDQDF